MTKNKRSCTTILLALAGLILISFDSTKTAFAETENQLISLYQSKKYSDLIRILSQESENSLDSQAHYLLLKSFNEIKNFKQSKRQLYHLEKKLPSEFSNLLLHEKLQLFKQTGQREYFLKAITEYRGLALSPFLLDTATEHLIDDFQSFKKEELLQQSLQQLIPYTSIIDKGPDLLRLYARTFADNDPGKEKILIDIWKLDNVENLEKSEQTVAEKIRSDVTNYANEIIAHFENQKQFKNYSYTIKFAPQFLNLIKDKKSHLFVNLRDLYFYSMIKKRQFSVLIETLKHPKNLKRLGLDKYEALSMQFELMIRKGDPKSAIGVLNRMIKMEPGSNFDLKYLSLAKYYFNRNYHEQALYFLNRLTSENSKVYALPDVKWLIWRSHFLMGNQTELSTIAQWARDRDFEDKEMGARFCYWGYKLKLYADNNLYRCYEQYPLTYYGLHSKYSSPNLQTEKSNNIVAASQVFASSKEVSESQRNQLNLLRLLYQLNENELADSITRSVLSRANSSLKLALAGVLLEVERYYMVQIIAESTFRPVLEKNISGSKLLLPYFYPLAYDKEISKLKKAPNVPKSLILSVMREESHFNPQVKSVAGAIGLMQLMPETAKYIGKTIGLRVKSNSLIEPEINLKIGSAYLNRLMKRYKGNIFYTLAAYNGGPTNVKRWIKKTKTKDNDDFVETITFLETQNYVRRVMRTFYIYRNMYEKS